MMSSFALRKKDAYRKHVFFCVFHESQVKHTILYEIWLISSLPEFYIEPAKHTPIIKGGKKK